MGDILQGSLYVLGFIVIVCVFTFLLTVLGGLSKRSSKNDEQSQVLEKAINKHTEIDNEPSFYKNLPYFKRDCLLTRSEYKFYTILRDCLNDNYIICPKVRLIDIFGVSKYEQDSFSYRQKIMQKHIDFLICDSYSVSPVFAIELDDSSHDRPLRQERDAFVNGVYKSAGLPLLHFHVDDFNTMEHVSNILEPYLTR
jgi:hypothetical protein